LVGDHGYLDLFGAAVKGDGYMAKAGAVEDANHGTLFLDELQDLRPRDQAHLLRFLNERRDARGNKVRGEFFRFGDKDRNRPRFASDVNLVCATLVDLDDERVRQEHGFREDLWNRIATRVVRVPPLSERPEDVHAFLETQPLDQEVKLMEALTLEAQKVALTHRWPGNFRALVNFRQQLPAKLSPGCVDAATCRRLLQASGRDGTPAPAAAVALHAGGTPALHSTGLDWAAINEEAARMFQNANGRPPGENQLVGYLNDYVKPVAIAHACGMQGERQIPRSLNLSGLARRLGFADGTTVRGHLERYLALF
jgi:DNA-binding NtrC family response regulator